MPKKEKPKLNEVPSVSASESVDAVKMDDIPDEEILRRMREEMSNEKPEFRDMFEFMERVGKEGTEQAQDSSVVFTNRREILMKYPNSPTAKKTMEAFNHYQHAFTILWSYTKPRVLLQSDCDFLQPGLHNFIEGYMIATYMLSQFPLPPSFEDLVEDYLQLRPNDILVEYIFVNAVVEMRAKKLPDYERCKETIRALEKFVHKLLPYEQNNTVKRILIDAFYVLGARYSSTDQDERALDAFEKCYALDETDVGALYGVAYHHQNKDPVKALKLCKKYLDIAPRCDEKFPNIHYIMAMIYAFHFKNIDMAKRYFNLGKKAESYSLPFNQPSDFPLKSFLESIMPLAEVNKEMLQKTLEQVDIKKLTQK